MPRIEVIPANWKTSQAKADGNGTPTFDVCKRCALNIQEENAVGLLPFRTPEFKAEDHIGSTDVEHPPFDGEEYDCYVCGRRLTSKDD